MKRLHILLLINMLILTALELSARQTRNIVEVKSYSMAEGLSQKMIHNMVQDEDKFVWMSSWNGLEKFDGYGFRNFKSYPGDSIRLSYNRLPSISTGPLNGLWCETYDSRMYIFDTREERFIDPFALHPGVRACEEFKTKFHLPGGVLWLVGHDGSLWRIDGKEYRNRGGLRFFQATRAERGETVYDICPDGAGGEWVLSNHGYWVYGKNDIHGLREFRRAVAIKDGLLLVDTDGRLVRGNVSDGTLRDIALPCRVSRESAMCVLRDGNVVLVTDNGLAMFYPRTGRLKMIDVPFGGNVTTFYEQDTGDGKSILWALSDASDVLRVDLAALSGKRLDKPYADNVESYGLELVHCDHNGEMWIYPLNGHLCHYDGPTGRLERVYMLSENVLRLAPDITSYMIDDRGNLWGCTPLGIQKITFPAPNMFNLSSPMAEYRGLMIDSKRRLWAASKNLSVSVYDSTYNYIGNLTPHGELVNDPDAKFGASMYAMMEDSRHRLWLGSRNHGLFVATPVPGGSGYSIRNYRHDPGVASSISNDAIYTIYEDGNGRVWIGTYGGGLNLVDESREGELRFLTPTNGGLPTYPGNKCRNVRHITCNSRGEMMLCTSSGLVTFDNDFTRPSEIKFYRNWCDISRDSTLSNNDVMYAFEDSRHDVYLAIMSGGICRVRSQSLLSDRLVFSYINRRNGLTSDMVYSIAEDRGGYLWIAVEDAICRYDAVNDSLVAYGRYDFHRPLLIGETPFVVDENDVATFTLDNSIMQVDLRNIRKSDYRPNIVFYDARVYADSGQDEYISIDKGGSLSLDPDQRNVSVSFVALDYGNTDNISYAYRLRGFNDRWIDNGHSHTASFYALSTGDYVLEVRSTNSEGAWNDEIYSLPIHVAPTFIETVWAKLLYILAFIALGLLVWYVSVYILRLQRRIDIEQELAAMKMKFFTDISHELRTPLTLVINPIDEVLADKSLSASSREYMTMAKSNTDRMLRLINQFLDIRKIQSHKMKIYLGQIDIVPVLYRIYNDFRGLARQKDIHFDFVCDMKACDVYTDVDKFEKIIFNLLSNAFKYTPDGLDITMTAWFDGKMLHVSVKDDGPGMEEWQKKSLFKRFETFGRKRDIPSSGIGLSLVKELLVILHGDISVRTVVNEGSTFEISIPVDYETYSHDTNVELILNDGGEAVPTPGEDEPAPSGTADRQSRNGVATGDGALTVMVVEDNAELRRMLSRMLSDSYTIVEAHDGQDALDRLDSVHPDIIISDIMMPRLDGLELLTHIRNDREWSHTPFVLLSAKSSVDERITGLDCGADDYLTKPFSASYLRARLRSLIERRSRLLEHLVTEGGLCGESADEDRSKSADNLPMLTGYDREFTGHLLAWLDSEACRQELTIDDIADEMKLGRTVFNRKVKSLFNCTPVELLTTIRLKHACKLLSESAMTVSEIAYKCGFTSPQYFNRVFKQRQGCTPVEWRNTR